MPLISLKSLVSSATLAETQNISILTTQHLWSADPGWISALVLGTSQTLLTVKRGEMLISKDYAHARNHGKYMYHSIFGLNVSFSYISQSGFYCLNPHIDGRRAGGREDGGGGEGVAVVL